MIMSTPSLGSGTSPGHILRLLSNVSEIADQIETDALLLTRQYQLLAQEHEIFATTTANVSQIRETVTSDLVKKVDSLFQRVCMRSQNVWYKTC